MLGRKDKVSEGRLTAVQYVLLGVFLVLAFGLWRLQIAHSDYYASLAEQNRIKQVPILAPRGKILDREGRIIVDNYPSFSVLLLRDQKRDLNADADLIASGLHMQPDELRARLKRMAAVPGYQPLFLKDDITPDELAFIESHIAELPELDIINVHRRLYPRNGFMAHVIGYVGQVSEEMLQQPQWELYNPGDIVGMSGLEAYYNDILMGKNGSRQVLVNSRGKEVGTLSDVPAVPGKQLRTTIDLDLQIAAEEALEGRPGAIVAMDPRNGEILAMVSRPAFDPNEFAVKITRDEWNRLVTDPGKPLLNKAIQAQLAPGSVFKIIMATAGLQEGIAQDLIVNCGGGKTFYGRFFKCWILGHGSHGSVGISKAIYQSCDSYFYTLAEKLGISRIAKYATMLGLGQKTGIDLPQEVSGVMPSEEWKIRNFKQKWYAGETISVGIGQGAVATTPIQLARALGAITMDGVLVRPHLAFPDQFPPGFKQVAEYSDKTQIPIDEKNWTTITDAMAAVVSPGGTAASAHLNGIDFAGKTGSAQTVSNELKKKMSASEKGKFKDNGWFVGVTPRRNPELVVAVLLEEGEHGFFAARAASQVIKAYVEKQRTRETLVAKQNAGGKAEVAAVWHQPAASDGTQPDNKLQAGHFNIDASGRATPVAAAPGMTNVKAADSRGPQTAESHTEMAQPEAQPAAEPAQPPLRSEGEQPGPAPNQKPAPKQQAPPIAPAQPAAGPVAAPTAELIQENHP
ncbi:MAG: penicillin-binding protein 2 [Candidatus Korobacteraceae bacterium]